MAPAGPPEAALIFSGATGRLYRGGEAFDPWRLAWQPQQSPAEVADAAEVTPAEALRLVFGAGGGRPGGRRVPVAVIGPREASAEEYATAEALGGALARLGLCLLCGGKSGVMEAACKGHLEGGGLPIGLLPDEEWTAANDYVAVPIATGIGNARNAIIARASLALVAVGGGYGTLSEMAFGLHYGRLVLTLGAAPEVPGALRCGSVEEAVERVARRVLGLEAVS